MLSLSQSHLTLLDACPRKYQYVFFDALSGPATHEQQATVQWGSQFHLLMQQRALDLPVEVLSGANADMAASMAALAEAAPEVFEQLPGSFSRSEHRRTLAFGDYLLTVVYDLVVLSENRGQIFDWKTHHQPPLQVWLQGDWQTRLYLYVLCETTKLSPEQLSMTYWFVRLGDQTAGETTGKQPSCYRFGYSEVQHRSTQKDLQRLTERLTGMQQQADFPKVAVGKGLCDHCPFNLRCDRTSPSMPSPTDSQRLLQAASQLTADSVEEIPL